MNFPVFLSNFLLPNFIIFFSLQFLSVTTSEMFTWKIFKKPTLLFNFKQDHFWSRVVDILCKNNVLIPLFPMTLECWTLMKKSNLARWLWFLSDKYLALLSKVYIPSTLNIDLILCTVNVLSAKSTDECLRTKSQDN